MDPVRRDRRLSIDIVLYQGIQFGVIDGSLDPGLVTADLMAEVIIICIVMFIIVIIICVYVYIIV